MLGMRRRWKLQSISEARGAAGAICKTHLRCCFNRSLPGRGLREIALEGARIARGVFELKRHATRLLKVSPTSTWMPSSRAWPNRGININAIGVKSFACPREGHVVIRFSVVSMEFELSNRLGLGH